MTFWPLVAHWLVQLYLQRRRRYTQIYTYISDTLLVYLAVSNAGIPLYDICYYATNFVLQLPVLSRKISWKGLWDVLTTARECLSHSHDDEMLPGCWRDAIALGEWWTITPWWRTKNKGKYAFCTNHWNTLYFTSCWVGCDESLKREFQK